MKCRYCDNEAVYPDGLCERCHQAEMESRGASVLSDDERDNFKGQTINEDGSVYEEKKPEQEESQSNFHIYMTHGLPLRIKLAVGFIVFCVLAIIISALGFLILALPYLLGGAVIVLVYQIVKSLLRRH